MNAKYKKIVFAALVVVMTTLSADLFAKCGPCAAAAAARASVQAALAALQAAGKPVSREMELDAIDPADMTVIEACCAECAATGNNCGGEYSARCLACQAATQQSLEDALAAALANAGDDAAELVTEDTIAAVEAVLIKVVKDRAAREGQADADDECETCTGPVVVDPLDAKLQALLDCCACVNYQVKHQARDAKKCCKRLHHRIEDVEDLVESQIDLSTACCSVTEGLIISQIDLATACCSVTEGLIISQIDIATACCSVTGGLIGDPLVSSVIDIPGCGEVASIVDIINATDIDVIAWLKSLYVLLFQVYLCSCDPCG